MAKTDEQQSFKHRFHCFKMPPPYRSLQVTSHINAPPLPPHGSHQNLNCVFRSDSELRLSAPPIGDWKSKMCCVLRTVLLA